MKNRMDRWSPEWEEKIFGRGRHLSRYVWSDVVTFTYQFFLSGNVAASRRQLRVLELGCGPGPNIEFFAKEGLTVCGVDGSKAAIEVARSRLAELGLEADLRLHDFADPLPYQDGWFDLVLDRAALTHNSYDAIERCVDEVHRVLKVDGLFIWISLYSVEHPAARLGIEVEPNTRRDIPLGMFQDLGQVHFTAERELTHLLRKFDMVYLEHTAERCLIPADERGSAHFDVVARKPV